MNECVRMSVGACTTMVERTGNAQMRDFREPAVDPQCVRERYSGREMGDGGEGSALRKLRTAFGAPRYHEARQPLGSGFRPPDQLLIRNHLTGPSRFDTTGGQTSVEWSYAVGK